MFIKVAADRGVTLEDRDNFRAFKLVVEGRREDVEPIRHALAGVAELGGRRHRLGVRGLAAAASQTWRRIPTWQRSLSAMIEKARPHGWIDEQRKAIKAHVEWVG